MSRFDWYGDEDGHEVGRQNLWLANVQRALNGKQGQQVLRELEEVLTALPSKRLVAGQVIDHDGEVCLLGAMWRHRELAAGRDPMEYAGADWWDELSETVAIGKRMGLTRTLATHLAWLNDEQWGGLTPEQRYERAMNWLRTRNHDTD